MKNVVNCDKINREKVLWGLMLLSNLTTFIRSIIEATRESMTVLKWVKLVLSCLGTVLCAFVLYMEYKNKR